MRDRHQTGFLPMLAVLSLCLFLWQVIPAFAASVDMEVSYGYDNSAKGGRSLPVTVNYDNRDQAEFAGQVEIRTRESDGSIYCYDYPVMLGAEEQKEIVYDIPIGSRANQLLLTLKDNQGVMTDSSNLPLNISLDVSELFIGILSDTPDDLGYLNGAGVNHSMLRTRTFTLDETAIPEDAAGLSQLDVIMVTNYRLRNLTEKQTAAIMDWVENGGLLILGTGKRVDDTMGRFAPELLDNSYGRPTMMAVDMGDEYAINAPGEAEIDLTCVNVPLHGGNVITTSNDMALLTAVAKEKGLIAVAAYDFTDIASFCKSRPEFVDNLFVSLLGEDRIQELAEIAYSGNTGKYWSVQSMINTGDIDKLPNLAAYVMVVAIYLIIVGPGLYLFLRGRELQIFYRRGVMVLSLIFAVAVYLMGRATRFAHTFYTYATIRDVTDDYVTDTTYLNIRHPYNQPYEVALAPDYSVLPITRSYSYDNAGALDGTEIPQITLKRDENQAKLQAQGIVSFSPKYFQMGKKEDNTEDVGLLGDVEYYDGSLKGTIKNQFPYPLEDVTLIMYGSIAVLGRMEAGETRSLDDVMVLGYPLSNTYATAAMITGLNQYRDPDINDRTYLQMAERTNLLLFYLDNYMSGYRADGRVIAFSTEKEESQFLKEQNPETYGMTMLTCAVSVYSSSSDTVYRSALMKTPRVISGSYSSYNNTMTGTEPVTVEYSLGDDIDIERLTLEPLAEAFAQGEDSTAAFGGNIYFYNYDTGNFDLMETEDRRFTTTDVDRYLSPANTMTVRYVYEGVGGQTLIQLPMPMVTGRLH